MNYCIAVVFVLSSLKVMDTSQHSTASQMPLARTIVATGYPYFKILMQLGSCHKALLYQDKKIWSNQRLNRILDIYYKSDNPEILVSRVELRIIVNNTDCYGYTTTGVGRAEFIGAVILPSNSGLVLYNLMIFTCNTADYSGYCLKHMLQYYINPKEVEDLELRNETGQQETGLDYDGSDHNHRLCHYEWLADETTQDSDNKD